MSMMPALTTVLAAADGPFIPGGSAPMWVGLMAGLPLLGAALCVVFACLNVKSKLPGYTTVALLAGGFVTALAAFMGGSDGYGVATIFRWIHASTGAGEASIAANVAYYMDGLSMLWMLFVTGLATVIGLYATEYVEHDKGLGYCRFFFAFNLFVFSMASLVMADNLLLLFLGWEGVGLCSYLLIGYFYKRPEAVAAAKKAFIMNRIGDLGLLMAIGATFVVFGTLEFRPLFEMIATAWTPTVRPSAAPGWWWSSRCCSPPERLARVPRSSCIHGCPTPWRARPRSRPSSTRPPW